MCPAFSSSALSWHPSYIQTEEVASDVMYIELTTHAAIRTCSNTYVRTYVSAGLCMCVGASRPVLLQSYTQNVHAYVGYDERITPKASSASKLLTGDF